jgi:hypothetical protein
MEARGLSQCSADAIPAGDVPRALGRSDIAHDSPPYADLVVERLLAAVERLEQFPPSSARVSTLD